MLNKLKIWLSKTKEFIKSKLNIWEIKKFIKKHLKAFISSLIVLISIIIVTVIVLNMHKDINEYTVEDSDTYIYFGEAKFEYKTQITLDNKSGITKLKLDGKEVDLDSQPLYYKGLKKVVLPNAMAVVFPLSNSQKKVPIFTQVDASEGDTYLINRNLNYPLSSAFLYDGNDLYFFIENTTIKVGDFEITVSPFSYAVYNYNKELYLYDYDEDKMYYLTDVTETVYAYTEKYKMNLSIDSIENGEKSKLLMKNLSYLEKLAK